MTEPQKEYIITEEQLQELIRWYPVDTWGWEKGSSFRSRPYVAASAEQVLDKTNKQPKGKYCYPDCKKFETSHCPYPGSNISMDHCNSFELRQVAER